MDHEPLGKAPWDAIAARVRVAGALSPKALVHAAGINGPKRKAVERVMSLAYDGPTLVGLPSGDVSHLVHVFDRCWLTQRVRSSTLGRTDLWVTAALAPLVTALIEAPISLASGAGAVTMSEHLLPAMVGPPGWLPEVPAGGLVALRLVDGRLEVRAVDEPCSPLAMQQDVRELVGRHYMNERWYVEDEDATRFTLTRALACAVLEVPELLLSPIEPMDELLVDPLHEQHGTLFRDFAACHQMESVSFSVNAMPVALEKELRRRARLFGMSVDQYVIAVLGHLAWRTPFAEDMEPWEGWTPAEAAPVVPLRPGGGEGTL
jgi:hypothetical protein